MWEMEKETVPVVVGALASVRRDCSISELQKITLMGTTEFFSRVNSLEPKVPGLDSVLHRLNKRTKNDNNYNNNNM